jgi:UDP-N-acetylglucosamine 2-epimerase
MRGANVLDVPYEEEAIYQAISRCVADQAFAALCRACPNPYGEGDAGLRIAGILAGIPIDASLLRKKMTF